MQNRLLYIDIAKAIGLCMVILSHSVYPQLMWIGIGCYVPIFYIVSGFTTSSINIAKKTKRLIGSYIYYSIFLLILYILIHLLRHEPLDNIRNMIIGIFYSRYSLFPLGEINNINFLHIEYNAPLWFLTSMFTGYLALIPILRFKKSHWVLTLIGIYILLTWIMAQCPYLLPWSIDCAPLMAIYMYLGIKIRNTNLIKNNSLFLWSIIIIGYIVFTYLNGRVNLSIRDYGNSIILCLIAGGLGSVIILKIAEQLSKYRIGKILGEFGKHSMTIFCLQMPLLVYTHVLMQKISILFSIEISSIATAICQLLITIVVGYLLSTIKRSISLLRSKTL